MITGSTVMATIHGYVFCSQCELPVGCPCFLLVWAETDQWHSSRGSLSASCLQWCTCFTEMRLFAITLRADVDRLLLLRPGREAENYHQFVCLCVCLCVRQHISGTAAPIFTKVCEHIHIPCGRGSVLLWLPCDTLFTSGFMDDVTFARSGPYDDAWKAKPNLLLVQRRCDTGAESDVYECLVASAVR